MSIDPVTMLDDDCELTLQFLPPSSRSNGNPPPPRPPPQRRRHLSHLDAGRLLSRRSGGGVDYPYSLTSRRRRNSTQNPGKDKNERIPPPFPWATDYRATVLSLRDLRENGITKVSGETQCKHCEARAIVKHDLASKLEEVAGFIDLNAHLMHDRAPERWTSPAYGGCDACKESNCMKPVIADKKRSINWLFLLLGQWLGCCILEQLKYFCKHNKKHRTGA